MATLNVKYRGEVYESREALADSLFISLDAVAEMIKKGKVKLLPPIRIGNMPKRVEYDGFTYPTKKALAKHLGTGADDVNNMIRIGLAKVVSTPIILEYKNVLYRDYSHLASEIGVSAHALGVCIRICDGDIDKAVEQLIAKGLPKIEFRGEEYESYAAFAKAINMSVNTLYGRLRKGWSLERIVDTPVKKVDPSIIIKGVKYPSCGVAAPLFGMSKYTLLNRIKIMTPDEAVDKPVMKFKKTTHSSDKTLLYRNEYYRFYSDIEKKYGLAKGALSMYMRYHKTTLKESVDAIINKRDKSGGKYKYGLYRFNSIHEIAAHFNISYYRLGGMIQYGASVREAVDTLTSKYNVTKIDTRGDKK